MRPSRQEVKEIVGKWKKLLEIKELVAFGWGEPFKGRHPRTQLIIDKDMVWLIIDRRADLAQIKVRVARELTYFMSHNHRDQLKELIAGKYPSSGLLSKIEKVEGAEKNLENRILSFFSRKA